MQNLEAADRFWSNLCNSTSEPPRTVIHELDRPLPQASLTDSFDVIVLGGTLGIFLAAALQLNGYKVAVVERNRLVGREQEWNISRADMQVTAALQIVHSLLALKTHLATCKIVD